MRNDWRGVYPTCGLRNTPHVLRFTHYAVPHSTPRKERLDAFHQPRVFRRQVGAHADELVTQAELATAIASVEAQLRQQVVPKLNGVDALIENLEEDEVRPGVENFELCNGRQPPGQRLSLFDALHARLFVIRLMREAEPEEFLGQRADVPDRQEAPDFAQHRKIGRGDQTEAQTAHAEIL